MIIFVIGGLALLYFQNVIGAPFVGVVLGLFSALALAVGYAAYSFTMSVTNEALANADPSQAEILRQVASENSIGHWKLAGLNVAILILFGLFAALRAFLIKRSRLF